MAEYTVRLFPKAQKFLDSLSDRLAVPILAAITALQTNPRPAGFKKLKGRMGYRIRSGNYRIIYEIKDDILLVSVITIGDRKDVYRKN